MKKRILSMLLLLALVGSMLVAPAYAQGSDLCPCGCGLEKAKVQWLPWEADITAPGGVGHYYLEGNCAQAAQVTVNSGVSTTIDLQGYHLTTAGENRFATVYGELTVMDSVGGGRLSAKTNGRAVGSVILVSTNETAGSAFRLLGGTVTLNAANKGANRGGLICVTTGNSFYMSGGVLLNGTTYSQNADFVATADNGGAIYSTGRVEITGGKIIGGKSDGSGGAIYSTGVTILKNCEIIGGEAVKGGGNIAHSGGELTIENAVIRDGVCTGSTNGGGNVNISSGTKLTLKGSTLRNGYSNAYGGNIYVGSSTTTLMESTTLVAGVCDKRGDNLYGNSTCAGLTIRNCQLPGDIGYAGENLVLDGVVKIGLLNTGLKLNYSGYLRSADVSGLKAGSEIYLEAEETFPNANPDYFKGAIRTVLTQDGENLVATQAASGEMGGYCPHCSQKVAWKAFNKTTCVRAECFGDTAGDEDPACTNRHIATGHYYLTASDGSFSQHYVGAVVAEDPDGDGTKTNITKASDDVVLDLAGYTLTSSGRGFYVREGGEGFDPSSLTMLDSVGAGGIKGNGADNQGGGVLYGETSVGLTVYGGNYTLVAGKTVRNGGVIYCGGDLAIHGGVFNASAYNNASYSGGAIYETSSKRLTVTAGHFVGGAAKEGGTLYVAQNATIQITGGQFTGGTALVTITKDSDGKDVINNGVGGNIRILGTSSAQAGTMDVGGCSVTYGHAEYNGGNFSVAYYKNPKFHDSYLSDGSTDDYGGNIVFGAGSTYTTYENLIVNKGVASRGANIYSAGIGHRAYVVNCYVTDGAASTYGGNFHAGNGYLYIKGGYFGYGTAGSYGGNIVSNSGVASAGNYVKYLPDENGNAPMIVGGKAATYGGNIYARGAVKLESAFIHNGTAKADGGQDIYYLARTTSHKAHGLEVGSGVTGNIILASEKGNLTDPIYAMPVADTACTTLNASITLENVAMDPLLVAKDGVLYVSSVAVVDGQGNATWFAANADAVAACTADRYVKLYTDAPVALTKDCAVDLNGHTVAVSGAYTLHGMDSATDAGTDSTGKAILSDETKYTQDHAAPNGKRYLAISEGENVTWHALDMDITGVSLRPSATGIYYNAVWNMDSALASQIRNFGIAISLNGMPTENFMSDATCLYTQQGKDAFVSGREMTSAIIQGILKENAIYNQNGTVYFGAEANDLRGQLQIYATPYVILEDGTCFVADDAQVKRSMKDVLTQLGTLVDEDPEHYRRYVPALREFYGKWKENGMTNWGMDGKYAFDAVTEDDVIDILMIGNSYCYYYVEELHEMAKAAGIKMRVCNLYYSGCPINNHYTWWKSGEKKYQYFEAVDGGKTETKGVSLEWALMQHQWDVLALQPGGTEMRKYTVEESLELNREARNFLFGYLAEQFPDAKLYLQQSWSFEIGHTKDDGFVMADLEQQIAHTAHVRELATAICRENGVARINVGDAWELYRAQCDAAGIEHNLCARLGKSTLTGEAHSGDGSHDGDIGGGQYLNACVWFEILTGLDCRENTYVPTYPYSGTTYVMDETMRTMLQEAAHKAVTELLPTYPEYTK